MICFNRQPAHKGRSVSTPSASEPSGPPNKPSISDLVSAKSRLRKGSSEYATPISEGVSEPIEPTTSVPKVRPTSSPHRSPRPSVPPPKTPDHNRNLVFTETPKEGSPGSSPAVNNRLGSRSSAGSRSSSEGKRAVDQAQGGVETHIVVSDFCCLLHACPFQSLENSFL